MDLPEKRTYYERNKEKVRAYTLKHKERKKEYDEKHKEHKKKYDKEYSKTNAEKLNARKNQKYECPCGGRYTWIHKTAHDKTIKHMNYEETQ